MTTTDYRRMNREQESTIRDLRRRLEDAETYRRMDRLQGWTIRMPDGKQTMYWCGGVVPWSPSIAHAIRFCRRADALAEIATFGSATKAYVGQTPDTFEN